MFKARASPTVHNRPRQVAFNFTSASHPLLSAFRIMSPTHGPALAVKTKDALARQLDLLLPRAQALGTVAVPLLPAEERDPYVQLVLQVRQPLPLTAFD
jgi:hypothetical protein